MERRRAAELDREGACEAGAARERLDVAQDLVEGGRDEAAVDAPGGPSYAAPKLTFPTLLCSPVCSMRMGGARGFARPIMGLWSKNAPTSPALADSPKPS